MNPVIVSLIVFVCVAGAAMAGMLISSLLPAQQLNDAAKDTVKVGMGLVGTMTAILLGLLIASSKSFFDSQNTEVTEIASKVALLDRALALYGPETKETRNLLKGAVSSILETARAQGNSHASRSAPAPGGSEMLYEKIEALSPQTDSQRLLRSQALSLAVEMGTTRWLMFAQSSTSVPPALLVVLVLWLALIFCSFGLLAPRNLTVVATLCLCAFSVSIAILLILEMYHPFGGLIRVSSAPLRGALAHLGQ
jgi:hypothetical protein